MALTADIKLGLRATQTGANDYGGPIFTPAIEAALALANGTGAGQADLLFIDQRTVGASSNDDLDLAGVLTDAFGATITAAELVAILVINAPRSGAANTSDLTIGGATSPFVGFLGGTTPTLGPLKPGAFFLLAAGNASGIGTVTASSADVLRIANGSGGSATYQIAIIARSA